MNSISSEDIENATKAWHSSQFLSRELQDLASSENLLLNELAMRDLEVAVALELRLQRLVKSILRVDDK